MTLEISQMLLQLKSGHCVAPRRGCNNVTWAFVRNVADRQQRQRKITGSGHTSRSNASFQEGPQQPLLTVFFRLHQCLPLFKDTH